MMVMVEECPAWGDERVHRNSEPPPPPLLPLRRTYQKEITRQRKKKCNKMVYILDITINNV